jgi:drug/metabolite transporter (DMT)-like permease
MAELDKSNIEKIGFWLTLLCGIHCIATPLAITFLPFLGAKFEAFHRYELIFLTISLLLALFLMYRDSKIHNNPTPIKLILVAIIVALIGNIFLSKVYEIYVSVSIAVLIITAYWLNWKHKERCSCEHAH